MAVEPPLGPSPFPGLGRWWGWTWNRSLKHQPVVRRDACAPGNPWRFYLRYVPCSAPPLWEAGMAVLGQGQRRWGSYWLT